MRKFIGSSFPDVLDVQSYYWPDCRILFTVNVFFLYTQNNSDFVSSVLFCSFVLFAWFNSFQPFNIFVDLDVSFRVVYGTCISNRNGRL